MIEDPTRTFVLPCSIASTKSLLMPMLNSSPPSWSRSRSSTAAFKSARSRRAARSAVRVSLSRSKSGFGCADTDESSEPIVMSPRRRSVGHLARMCAARSTTSPPPAEAEAELGDRAGRPDFCSSPDVLIWMKTFKGAGRRVGSAASVEWSWFAALTDVSVSTAKRFGMAAVG